MTFKLIKCIFNRLNFSHLIKRYKDDKSTFRTQIQSRPNDKEKWYKIKTNTLCTIKIRNDSYDKVVNLIRKTEIHVIVTSHHISWKRPDKIFSAKDSHCFKKKWPRSPRIFSGTTLDNKWPILYTCSIYFEVFDRDSSVKLRADTREAFQEHPLFTEWDVSGIALWCAMKQVHSYEVFIYGDTTFSEKSPFSYIVKSHSVKNGVCSIFSITA